MTYCVVLCGIDSCIQRAPRLALSENFVFEVAVLGVPDETQYFALAIL